MSSVRNSFKTDFKRAILSPGFAAGVLLEFWIFLQAGSNSDLFRISVPVICTLPYTTAWLNDYQTGFLKLYLPRTGMPAYIAGKILACGISGGAAEALGVFLCLFFQKETPADAMSLVLIFASGMLWAVLSATLAAWSNSRYIAYGGGFVIYYLFVILHERYFKELYFIDPYEWLSPQHTWIFGKYGVLILMGAIISLLMFLYALILRRCIRNV